MTGLKGSDLQQKITSGQKVFGTWVSATDPSFARMFSQLGFDFILIDMEHSALNPETLQTLLLMFSDTPTCPIVRVPWHEPHWSKWALDAGAEGILFPNVTSAEIAQQLASQCKYPPEGERGFFPRTASNFLLELPEYMHEINQRIQVWMQIEHIKAVENIEPILNTPGLNAVLVGPADLSFSLGIGNQYTHPTFDRTLQLILSKAQQAGIPAACHLYEISEEALVKCKEVQIFSFGFDFLFAQMGAKLSLDKVKQIVSG